MHRDATSSISRLACPVSGILLRRINAALFRVTFRSRRFLSGNPRDSQFSLSPFNGDYPRCFSPSASTRTAAELKVEERVCSEWRSRRSTDTMTKCETKRTRRDDGSLEEDAESRRGVARYFGFAIVRVQMNGANSHREKSLVRSLRMQHTEAWVLPVPLFGVSRDTMSNRRNILRA